MDKDKLKKEQQQFVCFLLYFKNIWIFIDLFPFNHNFMGIEKWGKVSGAVSHLIIDWLFITPHLHIMLRSSMDNNVVDVCYRLPDWEEVDETFYRQLEAV